MQPATPDDELPKDPERDTAPRRVKTAIHWSNGMVMCFDYDGRLLVELQGSYRSVRHQVMERSDAHTEFALGDWTKALNPVHEVDW